MDWKYKHFNQRAVFRAPTASVFEAARYVAAESAEGVEDTNDGFVARGFEGWHTSQATFHITSVQDGAQVAVELLVERAAMRGYMLVDIGGYYNGQIDKWFSAIERRLQGDEEPMLVSKTTSDRRGRRGCVAGCLVYLVVVACLSVIAVPLDQSLSARFSGPNPGPFTAAASAAGLIAGILVFLYVMYPDATVSKAIRERLRRGKNGRGK